MDAGFAREVRHKVRPAVEQLIAVAAERGLSLIGMRQDDLEITVERAPTALPRLFAETPEAQPGEEEARRLLPVLSTLVGTFRMQAPSSRDGGPTTGAPPASIGACVNQGEVLGYIESMRLLYEIHAPARGRLADILVDEGNAVEYGQPLMVVEEMD